MKRRSVVAAGFAVFVVRSNANPLAFIVTPLAEAILVTFKSTLGFFIKEWLPKRFKDSVLKSWATSVGSALGITEALNRIEHWVTPDSQTVTLGSAVSTVVTIANKDVNDTVSTFTAVALRDKQSGRDEVVEGFPGHIRLAANSGLSLTITGNRMPTTGYKEFLLISDGKVIGRSPPIRVTT